MKVAIVGLGAAGLRAAMLLERQGVDITLFDARSRGGGRLCTTDQGDEGGAEWIDGDHVRCLSLLEGLGLSPIPDANEPYLVAYKGERLLSAELWPEALEDAGRVHEEAAALCYDPPPAADATLSSFLDRHCRSERGRWWNEAQWRSDEGEDTNRIGLNGWLAGYRHYLGRPEGTMSAYRFPGANAVTDAMLARLNAKPNLSHSLARVASESGSTLEFASGETSGPYDALVLAIPPPCLGQIAFEPELPPETAAAIRRCPMGRTIKVSFEFAEPFWEDEGWHGHMFTDGPLQQTWNSSIGRRHLLSAYICGNDAESVVRSPDPIAIVRGELLRISARARPVRAVLHDWISDPWSRGAFSYTPVNPVDRSVLAAREGSIHFAGEHTASWMGFVEGALESAERVAAEITRTGPAL
ncbi:MAG: FAD-dependent oxidoreductase [Armatimonadetes bacterium]|nr:FAD-dependent oxidoreductase [Armatimonadota bacterium]